MKYLAVILLILAVNLRAQDPELTNYRTGIDCVWGNGTGSDKGTAYMEEYFYSDKTVTDRKVVYIRSDTAMTLGHNARNVVWMGGGPSATIFGNVANSGQIMYRFDTDMHWGPRWGDGSSGNDTFVAFNGSTFLVPLSNNPNYTTPLHWDDFSYENGDHAVGTVGPKPGPAVTECGNYYWRGILDDFGDEIHTLQVADNDSAVSTASSEWWAGDGKYQMFVVNPKTPAMTVRATGDAQFYTTPFKNYFTPKIFRQTTYIAENTGSVTFELRDIMGNNIHYRINGGAWIQVLNSVPVGTATFDDTAFSTGSNTLEYYVDGNQSANTKTRIVVKDPPYPSAGEQHGFFTWADSSLGASSPEFIATQSRLTRNPYLKYYNFYKTSNTYNQQDGWDTRILGLRNRTTQSCINGFVAKMAGYAATRSGKTQPYVWYAKQMLLNNTYLTDPVGMEIYQSLQRVPCKEIRYRGYYDMDVALGLDFAYDTLIANYRTDNGYPDGITAIEDYLIRDTLAFIPLNALWFECKWTSWPAVQPGMWGNAWMVGGMITSLVMPTYSTPYGGTSGWDGNTTVYPWTPFPDTPLTWKKAFYDNDATLLGYPNLHYRFGTEEYMINSDIVWTDKIDYWDQSLMGHIYIMLNNTLARHGLRGKFPRLQQAFVKVAQHALTGLVEPEDGSFRQNYPANCNRFEPVFSAMILPWAAPIVDPDLNNTDYRFFEFAQKNPHVFAWYDDTAFSVPPQGPQTVFSPLIFAP